jgi:hypothetical protein
MMGRLAGLVFALAFAGVLPAFAESAYPTPHGGRERIPRTGTCPTGFVGKGDFCKALHQDTPRAYPVIPGRACPTDTFRSGDACKAFR